MHYTYRFRLDPRLNSVNCWIITEIPVGNSTTTHSTNSSKFPNRRVHLTNECDKYAISSPASKTGGMS